MTKRFDEEVLVERDGGMPSGFEWRGRQYRVEVHPVLAPTPPGVPVQELLEEAAAAGEEGEHALTAA